MLGYLPPIEYWGTLSLTRFVIGWYQNGSGFVLILSFETDWGIEYCGSFARILFPSYWLGPGVF